MTLKSSDKNIAGNKSDTSILDSDELELEGSSLREVQLFPLKDSLTFKAANQAKMKISGSNIPVGSYLVQTSLDGSTCTLLDNLTVSCKPGSQPATNGSCAPISDDVCGRSTLSLVSSSHDGFSNGIVSLRVQLSAVKEGIKVLDTTKAEVTFVPDVAQKSAQLVPTKPVSDGIVQEFAGTLNLDQTGNFEVEYSIYDSKGLRKECRNKQKQKHVVECAAGYDRRGDKCLKDDGFCSSISLRKGAEQLNSNGTVQVISTDALNVDFFRGTGDAMVRFLPLEGEKNFKFATPSGKVYLENEGVLAGQAYAVLASRGESSECSVLSRLEVGCPGGSSPREGICVGDEGVNLTTIIFAVCAGIMLALCTALAVSLDCSVPYRSNP